jgi:predicted protein tyrosine phosphatase
MATQILPDLYLGDISDYCSSTQYDASVSLFSSDLPPIDSKRIKVVFDLEDGEQDLDKAATIIEMAIDTVICLLKKEKSVLLNCGAGWSRSATVAIGVLMKLNSINRPKAKSLIQSIRPQICPAPIFMDALKKIFGEERCLP